MSKLVKALRIEGTDRLQILAYAALPKNVQDDAQDRLLEQWLTQGHRWLFDDALWSVRIILDETEIEERDFEVSTIPLVLNSLASFNLSISFCLFDGVFSGPEDTLTISPEEVYAYWARDLGLNIVMDDEVRESDVWKRKLQKLTANFLQNIDGKSCFEH